jgi:hypothetical protein
MTTQEALPQSTSESIVGFKKQTEIKQFRQKIAMQFTENVLSRLTFEVNYHSISNLNYLTLDPVTAIKGVRKSFDGRSSDHSVALFSEIIGFDIPNSDNEISDEQSKTGIKHLIDDACGLLGNFLNKPEDQLDYKGKAIVAKYRQLKTPEGKNYDIEDFGNLLSCIFNAGLTLIQIKRLQPAKIKKFTKDGKIGVILTAYDEGISIDEIARTNKKSRVKIIETLDRYCFDEKGNLVKKNQKK